MFNRDFLKRSATSFLLRLPAGPVRECAASLFCRRRPSERHQRHLGGATLAGRACAQRAIAAASAGSLFIRHLMSAAACECVRGLRAARPVIAARAVSPRAPRAEKKITCVSLVWDEDEGKKVKNLSRPPYAERPLLLGGDFSFGELVE